MRVISGWAKGTKLESIDSTDTRPTLDRIKESLFNIIQNKLEEDTMVLDLFSGSGALGIECLSRGCKMAYFCDQSPEAIKMIKKNVDRTHFMNQSIILQKDYKKLLAELSEKQLQFDLIFLDPPYKENMGVKAIQLIDSYQLLKENGIIILETDEKDRDELEIANNVQNIKVYDLRKYGRVYLLFLS